MGAYGRFGGGANLTQFGIAVQGDDGLPVGLAVTVFVASLALLGLHRRELPIVGG